MRRAILALSAAFLLANLALAEDQPVLKVWPGAAPGEVESDRKEHFLPPRANEKEPCQRLTDVTVPTLTVFKADPAKNTGAAVVICPGGGYSILAWDKEGTEVAEWLNTLGVTGIVLKYRVPKQKEDPNHLRPLQDAQRAMSLVRSQATSLGIDPNRIGLLGFSAGGHLTAHASTNYDRRAYEAIDEVDQVSCRPDFSVLIYPAYLANKELDGLSEEIRVTEDTPPAFFAHAGDDRVDPRNSVQMFLALKQAGVPASLHIYAAGGHGFGLRPSEFPCSHWPEHCGAWLNQQGFLKSAAE